MPELIEQVPEAKERFLATVSATWSAIERLLESGVRVLALGHLDPGRTISLGRAILGRAGLHPLRVRTGGATAVSEDVGPSGTYGVVTMPGIPLSANGTS